MNSNNLYAPRFFDIGQPSVDWLTLTTYEGSAWKFWLGLAEVHRREGVEFEELSVMQYAGWMARCAWGTIWVGSGYQAGREHIMMRVGGQAPKELLDALFIGIREGWAKCTRIDLQVTVDNQGEEWCQWRLFNRLKSSGKTVGYASSKSGKGGRELATVYVGSRSSDRVTRIYEKETDKGDVCLRWETEYKGDRARIVAREIARMSGEGIRERLCHEVQKSGDKQAREIVEPYVGTVALTDRVRRVRGSNSTEKWLLETVLPSFDRVVNSHDNDGTVLLAFLDVAMKAVRTGAVIGENWPINDGNLPTD